MLRITIIIGELLVLMSILSSHGWPGYGQTSQLDVAPKEVHVSFPHPVTLDSVTLNHAEACSFGHKGLDEQLLEQVAQDHGIDSRILSTTIWRESGCNRKALGASGEIGLTQVNPHVWTKHLAQVGINRSLWDVETNLRAGAYILAYCQDRMGGDLWGTFRCYNGSGPKAERYADEQIVAYQNAWNRD